MRIATWNVNGIRARQEQLHDWLAQDHPEVIFLQEIKAAEDQVPVNLRTLDDYWSYWHGAKGYSGVALLVRKDICAEKPSFSHPPFDLENRIVTVLINEITIASVYVPNGGKNFKAKLRFLEALESYSAGFQDTCDLLILCGDINVARAEIDVHPKERKRVIGQLPEERDLFERILEKGLVDIGRALDPNNNGLFTWWAPWREMRKRNIGWRLDYILTSAVLGMKAKSSVVRPEVGTSDHAPVIATFEI